MFFLMILIGFLAAGSIMCILDLILPGVLIPFVAMGVRYLGVMLIWCGVMVYISRDSSTGGAKLNDLANPYVAKLIHVGKSSGKILNAKKIEPNRLRARAGRSGYMNIKDTGEPINIAGHDVFLTAQDIGHNYPLWVCDLIDRWKKKYGCRNDEEWKTIHDGLQNIKDLDSKIVIENKLKEIPILKPVLADEVKKNVLLNMKPEELRNMSELLYDGRTINAKAYLGWSEGATPYDNEAIIDSTVAQYRAQDASLRNMMGGDVAKLVIPVVILLICGAIAYSIFSGA